MTSCYIKSLCFRGSPLVWEYDQDTDKAVCLFTVIGASTKTDKKSIIAYLSKQKMEGLVIDGETVTLSKVKENYAKDFMSIVSAPLPPTIPPLNLSNISSPPSKPAPRQTLNPAQEKSRLTRSQNVPRTNVKSFFSEASGKEEARSKEPPKLSSSQSIPQSTPARTQKSKPSSSEKNQPTGLAFKTIFPENVDSDLAADTTHYQIMAISNAKVAVNDEEYVTKTDSSYFRNKYELELAKPSTVIHSRTTFHGKITKVSNGELLPVKEQQMKIFEDFFDNILDHLYGKRPTDPQLIHFFQEAIRHAMLNEPKGMVVKPDQSVNIGLTYLEEKPQREMENKSQGLAKEMIHQAIFERARVHLRVFRFFITNDIKSTALTADKKIQAELDALKLTLRKQRKLFAEACVLLEELTELTGKSGRIATKHKLISQIIEVHRKERTNLPLKSLMEEKFKEFDTIEVAAFEDTKTRIILIPEKLKENLIMDGYSCYQFIKNFLEGRFSEKKEHKKREHKKKEHIESITEQIIAKTVGLIHDNFNHKNDRIPNMYASEDEDFYFSESIERQLMEELPQLEAKLDQKQYEKTKYEQELVEICSDWIFAFIESLLQNKVTIDLSALEHKHISKAESEEAKTPRRRARTNSDPKESGLLSPRKGISGLFRSKSDRDTKESGRDETPTPKTPRNLSSSGKLDSQATEEKNESTFELG
ncbi:hypothetical protein [Legionella drozanskii]|uniref:Uncharacterized protein n=1 Tax=Legionella drozanskii LLAP-1 TaxID=1212489 RepID=A0A0W0TE16_9GAMM|nr:hypothetical protein [Legionella drozanskii]KTC93709.1 hypothetical protein Ldro_0059 [Legionella drozanskii LLAP-1]